MMQPYEQLLHDLMVDDERIVHFVLYHLKRFAL